MSACNTLLHNPMLNEYHDLQTKSQLLMLEAISVYHIIATVSYYDIQGFLKGINSLLELKQELNALQLQFKSTNVAILMLQESIRQAQKTQHIELQNINSITKEIYQNIDFVDQYLISISSILLQNKIIAPINQISKMMQTLLIFVSTYIIESMRFLSPEPHQDYY
ncbi:hypothetical protein A0J48_023265 [Sphaerospermopsis aphanizomenoides BCCUSP55]|uniref:hypothetical protein n=1 Tax=Sphaerospermopsis aphanizomenoides TaxID=459663 RepID=UPI001908C409|nr:hypothetical protein [Sphaerospermopsis aphanizomenoides]MBK1990407.1 hypothetical protein [Sphaerospermopsis aphanizomenoides BCCUSP55]